MSDQNDRSDGEPSEERKPDFGRSVRGTPDSDVLAELTRLAGGDGSFDHLSRFELSKQNEAQCASSEEFCAPVSLEEPTAEPTPALNSQNETHAADRKSKPTEEPRGRLEPARPAETSCLVFRPIEHPAPAAPKPASERRKGFALAAILVGCGILGGVLGGGASVAYWAVSRAGSGEPPAIKAEAGPTPVQAHAVPSESESTVVSPPAPDSRQTSESATITEETSTLALAAAGPTEPEPSVSRADPTGPVRQPAATLPMSDATPVQVQTVPSEEEINIASRSQKSESTTALVMTEPVKPEPAASPTQATEPAPQPAGMPVQARAAYAEVAPLQRETTVATPAQIEAMAIDKPWSVQLVSEKSESQALAAFERIQSEHEAILGSLRPQVTRVELGAKGIYYRVRIGARTQDVANRLCSRLQAAGGSCWVQRN